MKLPHGQVAGIIVAAGTSTRIGHDKVWMEVAGRPLLAWALGAFARCSAVHQLVVVVAPGAEARAERLAAELGAQATIVAGGPRRQDSVRAGLERAGGVEWVVVHDGARPLVTEKLIVQGLEAAQETGAAIAAVPEVDTVKMVVDGVVTHTPERGTLWVAQTPQVFRRSLLLAAHRQFVGQATDDAVMVEALGVPVRVYEGAYDNIKVTTPVDLQLVAERLRGDHPLGTGET